MIMKLPILKSCCWVCDLKIGVLIILWLGIIINTYSIIFNTISLNIFSFKYLMITIFVGTQLVSYSAALLGVYQKKPNYLIPCVIFVFIRAFLILFGALIMLLMSENVAQVIWEQNDPTKPFPDSQNSSIDIQEKNVITRVAVIMYLIFFALSFYVAIVVYNYYRQLRMRQFDIDVENNAKIKSLA